MKDGFFGQRRFVGHKKKNHFRIIVVCMKYKCQRGLVLRLLDEDTRLLRSMLLYGNCNCCGGGNCSCGHEGCGDDGCD